VSKGSYETVVEERSIRYETHISLKTSNLKTHHCNCVAWQKHGICKHVIAAIFAIRNTIATNAIEAKKTRSKVSKRKSSVDALLTQITNDELQQFVKAYSRKDKLFKLLLQGRFVNLLSEDELKSYVESSFPVLTKANEKVTPKQISTFLQVSDVLEPQFKAYIAQKDYVEAYRLIFLMLRKSFYIKSKLQTEKASFDNSHAQLINNYLETLNLIEAPEYREFLYLELKELLGTSYISANTYEERQLWLSLYRDLSKHDILGELLETYRNHRHEDVDSAYFMMMLQLLLAGSEEQAQIINDSDLQVAYRVLQLLQQYKDLPGVASIMSTYFCNKTLSNPLARLVISNLQNDIGQVLIDTGINYYLKYKNNEYLEWIKQHTTDWPATSHQIMSALEAKNDSFLKVQFHISNESFTEAGDVIKADNNWKLLTHFDETLFALAPDLVLNLYKNHIQTYLTEHFGLQSKDYTRMVFQRVYKVGGEKARKALASFIRDQFGERGLY